MCTSYLILHAQYYVRTYGTYDQNAKLQSAFGGHTIRICSMQFYAFDNGAGRVFEDFFFVTIGSRQLEIRMSYNTDRDLILLSRSPSGGGRNFWKLANKTKLTGCQDGMHAMSKDIHRDLGHEIDIENAFKHRLMKIASLVYYVYAVHFHA